MQPVWSIGLMTGTALDGMIDIAMIRTDGQTIAEVGPWTLSPYPPGLKSLLTRAVDAALSWRFEGDEPAVFGEAERALTIAQADAVARFLREKNLAADAVSVVGFHGQTVLHAAPANGRQGHTRQLGDGRLMAERLGIDVVYDFRTADMAAGGQGAPLAATYHQALLRGIGSGPSSAILNLGGVANLTWCDGDTVIAFDAGPANGPLNDWIGRHGRGEMDVDGAIARSGAVDEERLSRLLDHSFLKAPYPKSLDRYSFSADMVEGLALADGAATLAAFTAAAVGRALDLLPARPDRLIVCGGGRKNPAIMKELRARSGADPVAAEAVGLRGDAVEAECFAFLAVRRLARLPISFPLTTGVEEPMPGGVIARAARGFTPAFA